LQSINPSYTSSEIPIHSIHLSVWSHMPGGEAGRRPFPRQTAGSASFEST